jgi:hypothetical protein
LHVKAGLDVTLTATTTCSTTEKEGDMLNVNVEPVVLPLGTLTLDENWADKLALFRLGILVTYPLLI